MTTALSTSYRASRFLSRRGKHVQKPAGVHGGLLGTEAQVAAYGPEDGGEQRSAPGPIRADLRRAARGVQWHVHPRGRRFWRNPGAGEDPDAFLHQ